jgi:hypothetical protein
MPFLAPFSPLLPARSGTPPPPPLMAPPLLLPWNRPSSISHNARHRQPGAAVPPPPVMSHDIGGQGLPPLLPQPWYARVGSHRHRPSSFSHGAHHWQPGATAPSSLAMGLRTSPLRPKPPPGPMTDAWSGACGSSGRRVGAYGSGGRRPSSFSHGPMDITPSSQANAWAHDQCLVRSTWIWWLVHESAWIWWPPPGNLLISPSSSLLRRSLSLILLA